MKNGLLVAFGCVLVGLSAGAVEVDSIAAKVDSTVILKSDVMTEMMRMGVGPEHFNDVRNEMVERKLILKASQDAKMVMQDWVVENKVREIVQRAFGGDRNRLLEELGRQKVKYSEWHDRIRDDLIVAAMRWQIVDKNVTASPGMLRAEYREHPERYLSGKRTTVSIILLKPEDADKRDEVQKALKEEPFADVARRYSADAKAAEGGVWKDVNPDEIFKQEISDEISAMPKGTLSHWIDLEGWSFLIRKDEYEESHQMTFAEAYKKLERNVKEQQAEKLYKEWINRLKAEAYIRISD